jgi:DNA-binding phage protein
MSDYNLASTPPHVTVADYLIAHLFDDLDKLSISLDRIRAYLGRKPREMALRAGMSRSTIYKHLRSSNGSMRIADLLAICEQLELLVTVKPISEVPAGDDVNYLMLLIGDLLRDTDNLHKNLDQLRRYFNVSTTTLAAKSGLSRSSVSKHMRSADGALHTKSLVAMLRVLGYELQAVPNRDNRAQVERTNTTR